MKKLLLSVFVLGLIVTGCGKDNKTKTAAAATVVANPYTNVTSQQTFQTLVQAVAADSFGQYFRNANTGGQYYKNYSFVYYQLAQNCATKELFGMDWTKTNYCTIRPGSQSRTTTLQGVDVNAKRAELNAILSKATKIDASYNGEYSVYTNENKQYIINTQYPMQANPVASWDFNANKGESLDYNSVQ